MDEIRNKLIELQTEAIRKFMATATNTPLVGFITDHLIANGVTVQRWIPVEERLPDKELLEHQNQYEDEDLEVQVMIKGSKRPTTLFYNDEGEFYAPDGDGGIFYLVTHWMPMPEPPGKDVTA